jgi:hypothetical protein
VVARGQHMATQVKQLVGNGRREPKSARGIFRIGDHQINLVGFHYMAQMVAYDLASGTAEYIANEKYLHVRIFDTTIAGEAAVSQGF